MTRYPVIALTLALAACSPRPDLPVDSTEQAATCYRCGPTGDQQIEAHWTELGGVDSVLGDYKKHVTSCDWIGGFPICYFARDASVVIGKAHPGLMQQFQNGRMYWSPVTGPHVVMGPILDKYVALGEVDGYGFPFNDQSDAGDGYGRYNDFQGGGSIYWTPATGAHSIRGEVRTKWRALGAQRSFLTYPTGDDTVTNDGQGRYNDFQNGAIYWSPDSGAHPLWGKLLQKWRTIDKPTIYSFFLDDVNSYLGYPTGDQQYLSLPGGLGNGWAVRFQHGSVLWGEDGSVTDVPDSVSFHQDITTPSGTALGGWVDMTVRSDGSWSFKGHMHDSGFDPYGFRVVALVKTSDGIAVAGQQTGKVGGTIGGGPRDFDWDQSGTNANIVANWDRVRTGTMTVSKSYEDSGVLGTVEDVARTFVDSIYGELAVGPGAFGFITIGNEVGKLSGLHWAPPGALTGLIVYGATVVLTGPGAIVLAVMAGNGVHSRQLTDAERQWADQVFRGTIPWDRVVITDVVGLGGRPFTFPNADGSILVNLGSAYDNPTGSRFNGLDNSYEPGELLIHELTHAWQVTHSNFVGGWVCDALVTQGGQTFTNQYAYGPPTTEWSSFNLEQQARVVQQWAFGKRPGSSGTAQDPNDPYFHYIAEHIWLGDN